MAFYQGSRSVLLEARVHVQSVLAASLLVTVSGLGMESLLTASQVPRIHCRNMTVVQWLCIVYLPLCVLIDLIN